jgi:hypothetical protein
MDPARVATPADVLALERVLQANKQAIGDRVRFQQTDVAFRLAIASIPRTLTGPCGSRRRTSQSGGSGRSRLSSKRSALTDNGKK